MQARVPKYLLLSAFVVCAAVLLPTIAYAQAQIVGQVRDESGGVLPGVTVEAASPAIIEKVRTAVTDDQGRYRIDALRPGTYRLTFSLTGFSSVARESIDVPSEVVVTINADMKVGALEETITVSGETPQIDVQQASRTQVITREVIDTLPVSRNVMSIGVLSAGVRAGTPDVGGSRMTEQVNLRAHGLSGADAEQLVEGMSIQSLEGASQSYFDDMLQSEITIMTSAIPADTSGGGIRMNSVLKDGGNLFSGSAFLGFSSGEWQSDNVDDTLRATPNSIRTANGIKHIHMFTGSVGGPIKRDKLWFIVTARHQSSDETVADVPVQITTPQGEIINSYLDTYVRGPSLRMTWQAAQKHKLASFVQRWWKRKGRTFAAGQDPRTGQFRDPSKAHHTVGNIKYTSPLTNKLLFEGGYSWTLFDWHGGPDVGIIKERGTPEWYAYAQKISNQRMVDPQCAYGVNSGVTQPGCTDWGSSLSQRVDNTRIVFDSRMSYVTGSHNIKFGYTHEIGPDGTVASEYNGDLQQRFNNGLASQVTVFNTPLDAPGRVQYDSAFFVQDSWTLNRLTINPGLRIEWFAAGMDEASAAAGRFAPARFFPAQYDLIKWGPDYAPRFAAAYDLFGTGRTALKTSFSKYHRQYDADPFLVYADAGLRNELRNWFDVDLVPGTVGTRSGVSKPTDNDRIAQDNEIGTGSPTFGARAERSAGDFDRQYNLEFTAGVQHQVAPRLAVGFMFYKRQIKNIQLTDRTLITGADYTAFNTTIPATDWANIALDPAVAAVLNQGEVITLYNLNQASNAAFNQSMVDRSSNDNKSLYTGIEASFSMRFLAGSTIFGSWTAERNISVYCESDDNPNGPTSNDLYQGRPVSQGGRFCDQQNFDIPFIHEFKLAGNYSLPFGGIDFGAVLQSYGGLERVITWQPAAALYPGQQRTQAQTIVMNEPGSLFTERWDQLDINFKKNIRYGNKVHTFQLDLFNVFNNNSIREVTNAVGTSLGQVTAIMPGRFPRLAYQFRW